MSTTVIDWPFLPSMSGVLVNVMSQSVNGTIVDVNAIYYVSS